MKLRRRDPNQIFLAQAYNSLNHNGSETQLKKFRTLASVHTMNTQQSEKKQHTNQTQLKRTKTISNNQSRAKKSYKKQQSSKLIVPSNHITNVNEFKHLTTVHYMDPAQMQWVFGLRNHELTKSKRSISQVPSAYYKSTESSKIHHQTSQIPLRLNFNNLRHLAQKGQNPSMGVLKFQASLRQVDEEVRKKSPQLLQKQKSFKNNPIKDKNQYPKLLNSQSLKKKIINPQRDMQSALDGDHKFPQYTDRIVLQRNFNNLRQHLKNVPRSKISLPSLGWQTSLRAYEGQLNLNKQSRHKRQASHQVQSN